MDVAYTEHSHVIGKGGGNIKKVMEVTSCHIHFPDSNRHNAAGEKSNQVCWLGLSVSWLFLLANGEHDEQPWLFSPPLRVAGLHCWARCRS